MGNAHLSPINLTQLRCRESAEELTVHPHNGYGTEPDKPPGMDPLEIYWLSQPPPCHQAPDLGTVAIVVVDSVCSMNWLALRQHLRWGGFFFLPSWAQVEGDTMQTGGEGRSTCSLSAAWWNRKKKSILGRPEQWRRHTRPTT